MSLLLGAKRLLSCCHFASQGISRHFNKYSTQHEGYNNAIVRPKCFLSHFADVCRKSDSPPHPLSQHTNNPTTPQSLSNQLYNKKKEKEKMVNSKWQKVLKNCGKSLHDTDFRVFPSHHSPLYTRTHTHTHSLLPPIYFIYLFFCDSIIIYYSCICV